MTYMEESKKPNSALRDDNNEIIGNIPSELLIRSNITIIAVLAIILCLSVFVPYKDTVSAPIHLGINNGTCKCEAFVVSSCYGKKEKGQKAKVTLDIYPRNEFGTLSGHIVQLTDRMYNGRYCIKIDIDSLQFSYGRTARLLSEMTGTAEIVTSEEPVLCKVLPFTRIFFKR